MPNAPQSLVSWPWPAPEDDGEAAHLTAGWRLPALAHPATIGPPVDLSRHPGLVALFVYPWTGTPGLANPPDWDEIPGAHGSTPELERVRDLAPFFASAGCAVLGLSGQSSPYQGELARRLGLIFPLLSDEGLAFADALRLPRFETGGVVYLKRLTLVVRDGVIVRCLYPAHPPHTHPDEVLGALA